MKAARAFSRLLPAAVALSALVAGLAAGAGAPPFPEAKAWEHLNAQCAFGPRVPGTPGHARCADYLERTLKEAGGAVRRTPFRATIDALADSVVLQNISARFGPPGAPVLLGAHWDTRPWADRDPVPANRSRPISGANDGASGTAVLLAVAAVLGKNPPPIPVEIVLFDGEDQGKEGNEAGYLIGSRRHARSLIAPLPRVVVVIDIVGGKELHICREGYSQELAPWLNDLLFERAAAMNLQGFEDRVCYSVFDDHVPFLERGIASVDLVDMHFRQWHTLEDSPGTCSQESLGQVGRLLVDFLFGGSLQ